MKKITLLFILIAVWSQAQIHRFIYEYKYVPDITQKDTIRKDLMALDITEKGSTYQSLTKMEGDSTTRAEIEKMMKSGGMQPGASLNLRNIRKPGTVEYKVTKEYPDFKHFILKG